MNYKMLYMVYLECVSGLHYYYFFEERKKGNKVRISRIMCLCYYVSIRNKLMKRLLKKQSQIICFVSKQY